MTLPSRFVPLYSANNCEAEGPFLPDAPALVKEKPWRIRFDGRDERNRNAALETGDSGGEQNFA